MVEFGLMKRVAPPGCEIFEDWRLFFSDAFEIFIWTQEELKRICQRIFVVGYVTLLTYLAQVFCKSNLSKLCFDFSGAVVIFDVTPFNFPQTYEEDYER